LNSTAVPVASSVSLLTLQDNRFKDNSNYNLTLTSNGNISIKDTSPFTPVTINPTIHGGSVYLGGLPYLSVPNQTTKTNFNFGAGDFTIECWVYGLTNAINSPIFSVNNISTASGWAMYISNSTGIGFERYGYGSNSVSNFSCTLCAYNWNHIAIVKRSNTLYGYLNGVQLIGTNTSDSDNTYNSIPYNPAIGADQDGTQPFNGYISNVRVIKGTALYTSNFTPSTSPLTNIAGTSLLLNTNNYGFKTTATETYSISSFTSYDGSNNLLTPYPQNWQILKLTNPLSANNGDVINYTLSTSNPNQLSLMGSAITATDTTGVNRLSTVGTPTLTSFKPYTNFDNSLYLNGSTDWITVPASTNFNLAGDFTIECWVNTSVYTGDTNPNYRRIFGFGADATNNLSLWLGNAASNSIAASLYANANVVSGSIPVADGNWHHVAAVRYNNSISLYVDGVRSGNSPQNNITVFNSGVANPLSIGSYNNTNTGRFNGYLNQFRIVNGTAVYTTSAFTPPTTPLTNIPNTVFLMKNGVRYDQALISNASLSAAISTGSVTTLSSTSPFSPNGWSAYFDSTTTNYIRIPNNSAFQFPSSDFTIEFWTYSVTPNNNTRIIQLQNGNGATNNYSYTITLNGTHNLSFGVYNSNNGYNVFSPNPMPANTWVHYACVKSGTNLILYVNGVSSANATCPATINNITDGFLYIGSDYGSGFYFGYLNNLRIVGSALYAGQSFTLPTAPLTNIKGTRLLTFQNYTLKDNSIYNFTVPMSGTIPIVERNPFTAIPYDISVYDGSIKFSGGATNDFVSVPANPLFNFSGDFTLEFWINTSTYTQDTVNRRIFSFGADAASNLQLIFIGGTDPNVSVWNTSSAIITGTIPVANGNWHHIAVSRFSGLLRLFVDGVQSGTTASNSTVFNAGITNPLSIGSYNNTNTGRFIGLISNFRIINGVGLYTSTFVPTISPLYATLGTSLFINASSYSLSSYRYTPSLGDVNIGGSLKGLNTEPSTIQADSYTIPNNLYIHNQGTLNFPLTSSKTLTLNGSAGLQITSDGTLNVGTSSSSIPLSTTHTIILSNTQIDVHNGGNLNVYGYPKLFTTNLVNDTAAGSNTFVTTDTVSGIWNVGDTLTFKPNLSVRNGFDTLTIASITGPSTFTTSSNSVYFHTGSATYANIAGVYNLNRNVIVRGLDSTNRGTIRTIDAAKTSVNYAQLSNFGINAINKTGLVLGNNLSGSTTLSGSTINSDNTATVNNIAPLTGRTFQNVTINNNIINKSNIIALTSLSTNNLNVNNNYILSSGGIGLQMSNLSGSINMSNNTTIGSLSYGTYIFNNTLTGTYGANNFNSNSAQGMYIVGANTGTIIGGGLNSPKEGVYVDASTSNLSGVTFQNILANNNTSVGFKVSGNSLNYLTPVVLNINGLTSNTNSDAGFEGYNITGNISSVVANNNYVNGIKTSIGNGPTVFDGLSSSMSTIISTYPITQTGTSLSSISPFDPNGWCGVFNGSTDYITAPLTNMDLTTCPWTIEAWLYPLANANKSVLAISKGTTTSDWQINVEMLATAGTLRFQVWNGTSNYQVDSSAGAVSINQWNHVAFVKNGTTITLYINGSNSGSFTNASIATINNVSSTGNLKIGWNGTTNSQYNGYISNFRVLSGTALYSGSTITVPTSPLTNISGTSLLTLQNYYFKENSNYNNTLTLNGTPSISAGSPFTPAIPYSISVYDGAIKFNGSSISNITTTAPLQIDSKDCTIECWVYISSTGANQYIVSNNGGGNWFITSTNTISYWQNGATNLVTTTNTITYNMWNHIAMVKKGTTVSHIINGVYQLSGTCNVTGTANATTYIGSTYTPDSWVKGYISNLRIITGTTLYTAGVNFTPSTIPLSRYSNSSILNAQYYQLSSLLVSPPTINTTSLNILTAYNYSPTIIRNALLSATSIDPSLSAAVGLKLDSSRFSKFSLENSTLSATTPIQLNSTRNVLEGSYLFNNSYVGPIGFVDLTKYQGGVSRSTGFGFTNYNKISGNNFTYLPAGTKAIDTVIYDSSTSDLVSERLTPSSATSKLRSSSKFVALNIGDFTAVRTNVLISSAYNGNAPRVILKRNPSANIYDDTVVGSPSMSIRDSFQTVFGITTPSVIDNAVLEFYVDCDGTSGYVCVDTWTAT